MTKKRIERANLPARLPISNTVLCFFLLDYYNAPGWLWGALVILYTAMWLLIMHDIGNSENIDLLDGK